MAGKSTILAAMVIMVLVMVEENETTTSTTTNHHHHHRRHEPSEDIKNDTRTEQIEEKEATEQKQTSKEEENDEIMEEFDDEKEKKKEQRKKESAVTQRNEKKGEKKNVDEREDDKQGNKKKEEERVINNGHNGSEKVVFMSEEKSEKNGEEMKEAAVVVRSQGGKRENEAKQEEKVVGTEQNEPEKEKYLLEEVKDEKGGERKELKVKQSKDKGQVEEEKAIKEDEGNVKRSTSIFVSDSQHLSNGRYDKLASRTGGPDLHHGFQPFPKPDLSPFSPLSSHSPLSLPRHPLSSAHTDTSHPLRSPNPSFSPLHPHNSSSSQAYDSSHDPTSFLNCSSAASLPPVTLPFFFLSPRLPMQSPPPSAPLPTSISRYSAAIHNPSPFSVSLKNHSSANAISRRSLVSPYLEMDTGLKLGNFIIDILVTTGHVDIHLVTKGLIVEGLDRVTAMLSDRFIQFEVWTDLPIFLPHLVKTEGYLSKDQFLVYGSSADTMHIIRKITTWYYVVLDNEAPIQELADSLEEGSQALLLRPSTHGEAGTWAAFTLISRGDGVRRFRSVGRWSEEEGLVVERTLFPPQSKTFHGRSLTVGVINKPRVFHRDEGTGEVKGYSSDILRVLQAHLNFTVSLRWFETFGSVNPDGSWNGVIGALFKKEIDFSPMDFTPTKESRTVIDFSDWVSENPVVITSAAPRPQDRPFLLLEVYRLEVYPVLGLMLIFGGVMLWAIQKVDRKLLFSASSSPSSLSLSTEMPGVSASIFEASRTIVSQCIKKLPKPFSARVFLFHLWVVALVVDSVYQGHITAFIAMPRSTPQIDRIEQVRQNMSLKPVTELESTTERMIKESDISSLTMMLARLEAYDSSFLDSAEFFNGVASGRWAYIDTLTSAFGRSLDHEIQGQNCRFHLSRQRMAGGLDAWPFPRNSPVNSAISESLKWLRFFGVLEHIKSRYYALRCRPSQNRRGREGKKMNLVMTQSLFFIFLVGAAISFLAFTAEFVVFYLRSCLRED